MLTTNLSTRPFYNERAVHLALAVLGIAAVSVLAVCVVWLVDLARSNTELTAAADENERDAAGVAAQTAAIRRGIGDAELAALRDAASEANRLIDQRVFSWTEFFNRIERTLPADVMLTGVRPDHGELGVTVSVGVIGKSVADIDEFIERLEATGAFTDTLARREEITEEGTYRAELRGRYLPDRGAAPLPEPGASP